MQKLIQTIKQSEEKLLIEHPQSKSGPETVFRSEATENFKAAFDSFIVASADRSRNIEDDGFHPSILGVDYGHCPRYQYYLLTGNEKNVDHNARVLRIFDRGSQIHESIQEKLAAMGFLREAEVDVDWAGPPPIKGHADGVGWWDKPILLEFKSINQSGYDYRLKYKRPLEKHFDQANIYAYVLEIDTIWIFYINKNTEEYEVFDCPADRKAAEKQIAKWKKVWDAVQAKEIPDRKFKETSKECSWCPFKEMCWK